jgi:putative spermidine/putrescine transport system substrate-binding protein
MPGNPILIDNTDNRVPGEGMPRRRFLYTAGGLMLLPSLGFAQSKPLAGKKLVYVSWGGVYQDSQNTAFCKPFMAETGARVIQDGPMDEAKVRTMVQYGKPDWDVCDVTDTFLFNGQQLFEKVDYKVVDRSAVRPEYAAERGVGSCVWSYNVAYNTKAFAKGAGPKNWADVFDVKRFPGKRALRDRVYSTLEIALLADGVAFADLYPLDVDRAFKKLDTIKKDITWWGTPSQSQQLFVDGAVSCGVIQNGRAYDAVKKGAPLAIEWSQNLQSVDYLSVVRGSQNRDTAMALLNRSIQADAQAKFANLTGYAPVNPKAFDLIDKSIAPWLSTRPENVEQGVLINAQWWTDKLEKLHNRWLEWKLS